MANVSKISDGTTTYNIATEIIKNQNTSGNSLKMWSGTKAQYNALVSGGTIDDNTLYNIIDDANGSLNIYNKGEVNTLLESKANTNLANVSIPHLISIDTDGTQWCKTYSNGWCEQFCVYSNIVSLNSFSNAEFTWRLYKPITTFVSGHATIGGNAGIIPADVYSNGSTTEVKFWLHNALNSNVSNITIYGKFYVEGWL